MVRDNNKDVKSVDVVENVENKSLPLVHSGDIQSSKNFERKVKCGHEDAMIAILEFNDRWMLREHPNGNILQLTAWTSLELIKGVVSRKDSFSREG